MSRNVSYLVTWKPHEMLSESKSNTPKQSIVELNLEREWMETVDLHRQNRGPFSGYKVIQSRSTIRCFFATRIKMNSLIRFVCSVWATGICKDKVY